MAVNTTGVGSAASGGDYSYAYLQSEPKIKEDAKKQETEVQTVSTESSTASQVASDTKKSDELKADAEATTLYEEQQDADKKAQEEKKKQQEEEARAERVKELSDELNKRMNSFSDNIKFGINDKSNSIVVSVIEQNNERKVKELSKEDAEKLFKRLDYVLGVLFDSKG